MLREKIRIPNVFKVLTRCKSTGREIIKFETNVTRKLADGRVVNDQRRHDTQRAAELDRDRVISEIRAGTFQPPADRKQAECGEQAAALLQRTVLCEGCLRQPLVLHSDNGAPMKSTTLLSKMYELGITPSRGRPRVSNDNPYSESLFRTLKYCPQWPRDGFADVDAARAWVRDFVHWYNHEHRHSRIRFVTPAERHIGSDVEILAKRDTLYRQAQARNPARWSRGTRNWMPTGAVTLNPERVEMPLRPAA